MYYTQFLTYVYISILLPLFLPLPHYPKAFENKNISFFLFYRAEALDH